MKPEHRAKLGLFLALLGVSLAAVGIFFSLALPLLKGDKVDAFWFVLQTVTTTGYGSFPEAVWNDGLKRLSIWVMLFGIPPFIALLGAIFEITLIVFEALRGNQSPSP